MRAIIVWIFGVALLVCGILFAEINKPKDLKIDLSKFSGRIFKEDQVKPGTFTVNAPANEAVTWGSDAILRYGNHGVQIWRPDRTTSGTFQYWGVWMVNGTCCAISKIDGKTLTVTFQTAWYLWFIPGFLVFVICAIISTQISPRKSSG